MPSQQRRRARFHSLTVSEVRRLTPDAVEVAFAVPADLVDDYDYLPGQYVAVRAMIDGEELRRSYSICAAPRPGEIRVAIKRDRGGKFSTWANESLRAGDVIDVMNPMGNFTSRGSQSSLNDAKAIAAEEVAQNASARIVAIAAGSGITPIMAITSAVLHASPTTRVDLIYANKGAGDVMFVEELGDLKDRYPARMALHHVLSREQRMNPLHSGRIDADKLRVLLTQIIGTEADEWFLCGPFELVQLCRDTLRELGVPDDRVRFELFTTGDPKQSQAQHGRPVDSDPSGDEVTIEFQLDGLTSQVSSPRAAHETVLNAALRTRSDVPFACAGGVCGTCRAKVTEGEFTMDENYALEPAEVAQGYVLTCQTRPTGERLVVDYDA